MAKKIISEVEKQLLRENQELQSRLYESEETLNALRNGEVDAIVVQGPREETIYSLTSTETPYRIIIEEMCEGAATLLADGTILYCNSRFAELVSVPHEEVMGANIYHFFTKKEKERFGGLMKIGLEKGCNGEIPFIIREGKIRYLNISFSPLPPSMLSDVCILISDITDRKKAEQALKDSEELHRITMSSIQDPVFITNDTGIFTFICPNVYNLLGYTPQEIKQMGNISSIVGDHLFDINDLNTHGVITNIEQKITNKSGIEWDFLITVSRVSILDGTILYVCHNITELKKAQQSLKESETKYHALIENSPDGIVVYAQGKIVMVNKEALHLMRASNPDELIGKQVIQFAHPDYKEFVMDRMKKLADNEAVLPFVEEKFIRLDGVEIDLEVKAISVKLGNMPAVQVIIRDITERKRAEELLRKRENELKEAQRIGKIGSWEWDIKTDTITWSDELYRIFRYDPKKDTPTYLKHLELYTFESQNILDAAVSIARQTGKPYELDLEQVPFNGERNWVIARGEVKRDKSGEIVGMRGTAHDITKRKLADSEIRLQGEIMSNLAEAVYLVRMDDGVIVYSNPRFEQIFGYEKGEMLGKHVSIVNAPTDMSPENTAKKIMDDLAKNGFWNGEVRNIRKDGTPFWSYARITVFDHSQFGKVLVAVHEDITERRKAEEKISASLKEKETLLHEIHHRVRNNLQAIIALVRIRARLTRDADTIQFLTDLENQAYAMALVYEQLHQSEDLGQVGMAQYLLKLTTNVMVTYGRPDSIQFHLDASLTMDMEHATPCGLIVNELFSNILKHAFPPGFRGKPTVSIVLKQDDKAYHLTVSDNGVGIPPGYDWHKSQSMGLHLVNLWVTHQLGGTLAVSGKSGTTFSITFNLKD